MTAITPTKTHRLQLVEPSSEHLAAHSQCGKIITEIRPSKADKLRVKALSPRESECLLAAANGMTEKETARLLGISPNTVAVHIANCRVKLNARNKLEAVIKGLGLIKATTWCQHCKLIENRPESIALGMPG